MIIDELKKHPYTNQLIFELGEIFKIPGGTFIKNGFREWVDGLDDGLRSALNPFTEQLFRATEDSQEEGESMPPKKGTPNQPKQGEQPKGDLIAKARQNIAVLEAHIRSVYNDLLSRKSIPFQLVALGKLGGYTPAALKGLGEDLIFDGDKADLYAKLGITSKDVEEKEEKGGDYIIHGAQVITWLPENIRRILFKAMGSVANDTDKERESVFRFFASFRGTASDSDKQVAEAYFGNFADMTEQEVCTALGIRKNLVQKLTAGLKGQPMTRTKLEMLVAILNAGRARRGMPPLSLPLIPESVAASAGSTTTEPENWSI